MSSTTTSEMPTCFPPHSMPGWFWVDQETSDIPDLRRFKYIKYISIESQPQLTNLPKISQFTDLQYLRITHTSLKSPICLSNTNLHTIDLSHNKLTKAPVLSEGVEPTKLNLNYNQIESIPSNYANLPSTCKVSVLYNRIPLAEIRQFLDSVASRREKDPSMGPILEWLSDPPKLEIDMDQERIPSLMPRFPVTQTLRNGFKAQKLGCDPASNLPPLPRLY